MSKRRFNFIALGLALLALAAALFWRHRQPRPLCSASFQGRLGSPAFSPNGRTLSVPTAKGIALWDVAAWRQVGFLSGDGKSTCWTPDSKSLLVFGSHDVGYRTPLYHSEASLLWWNTATGSTHRTLQLRDVSESDFKAVSHDLKYAVFQKLSLTVRPIVARYAAPVPPPKTSVEVWDTVMGKKVTTLPLKFVRECQFSQDGTLLVAIEGRGVPRLRLWDTRTWHDAAALVGSTYDVDCARFSPDGKILAVGTRQQITLWDTKAWRQLRVLPAEFADLFRLSFSADGKRLLAGGRYETDPANGPDFYWVLWDVATGRKITDVHHSYGWGFVPDSNVIVTDDGKYPTLTTLFTDEGASPVWSSEAASIASDKAAQIVTTEAVSSDGRFLATGTSLVYESDSPTAPDRNRGLLQLWSLH